MESPSSCDKHDVKNVHCREPKIQADCSLSQSLKNEIFGNDHKYTNDYLARQSWSMSPIGVADVESSSTSWPNYCTVLSTPHPTYVRSSELHVRAKRTAQARCLTLHWLSVRPNTNRYSCWKQISHLFVFPSWITKAIQKWMQHLKKCKSNVNVLKIINIGQYK